MTTEADGAALRARQRLKAGDFCLVAPALHVLRSGTVARLAAMPVVQRRLEMGRAFKPLFVEILVASLASITPDVLGRLLLGRRGVLFLLAGSKDWSNQQQQEDYWLGQLQDLFIYFSCLQGQTPRFAALQCSTWQLRSILITVQPT